MFYTIKHITKFRYSAPIRQSVMELRMQPRSEGNQHCLNFALVVAPRSQVMAYRDEHGNTIHHFDVPGSHSQLAITAQSLVEIVDSAALPKALDPGAWDALDTMTSEDAYWDALSPSHFTQPTPLLRAFASELELARGDDPLSTLRRLMTAIHDRFEYVPQSTRVDSPIDEALEARRGVCQDFAHIMIALVRELGIPCRYVSGYLFHRTDAHDRSAADATHAWVEALLPRLGWVGFDPTNNLLAVDRHIRVAVGRDYADVPPSRGVFKGKAETELSVMVQVAPAEAPPLDEPPPIVTNWPAPADPDLSDQPQQQ